MNKQSWAGAAALVALSVGLLAGCQRNDQAGNGESTTTASTMGRDAATTTTPPGAAEAAASAASTASGPR